MGGSPLIVCGWQLPRIQSGFHAEQAHNSKIVVYLQVYGGVVVQAVHIVQANAAHCKQSYLVR